MRQPKLVAAAGLLVAMSFGLLLGTAIGQQPPNRDQDQEPFLVEIDAENRREVFTGSDLQPSQIGFIDSSNPYCYQPAAHDNVCYINWRYTHVAATDGVRLRLLTIHIEDRLVAEYRGFFENAITVHYNTQDPGYRVACGVSGDNPSQDPDYGKQYRWSIRAEASDDSRAANAGFVNCPPFLGATMNMPTISR